MTHGEIENPPMHMGMLIGGTAASVVGGIALPVILTVGFMSRHVSVPSGVVGLAVAASIVGAFLLGVRLVRRDLARHRAEHQGAALTVEDVQRLNARLDSLDRRTAEMQELIAYASVSQPAAPVPTAAESLKGERMAYAHGAVDMLDGHAAVVPINGGSGLRIVPVRDARRTP